MKWRMAITWLFEGGLLCQEGATISARRSVPLVDEVIFAEDCRTGTVILDSNSNRTISEDVEVQGPRWRQGFAAKGLSAGMVIFTCQLM